MEIQTYKGRRWETDKTDCLMLGHSVHKGDRRTVKGQLGGEMEISYLSKSPP